MPTDPSTVRTQALGNERDDARRLLRIEELMLRRMAEDGPVHEATREVSERRIRTLNKLLHPERYPVD